MSWRQSRLRDVVRVRYVIVELMGILNEGLAARGLEIEDVWTGLAESREIVDSMPSADVCVSIMTEYHRNPRFEWTPNDMFDMDALSVAVAYCDVVVTDKKAAAAVRSARLADRLGTHVLTDLREVPDTLAR